MNKFLIDANLPKLLRFWHDDACVFLPDDEWHDSRVWLYARENNLTIVTKDGDFEKLALAGGPPVVCCALVCGPGLTPGIMGASCSSGGPPPAWPASSPAADWYASSLIVLK